MAIEAPSQSAFDFAAGVARAYTALVESPSASLALGLGGKLFYAGELDEDARSLVVAANIAGAATLTATADRVVQKQSLRDGVIDFAVTTLDEALRILKNQLRKRETVAVCVGQPPAEVEREMNERGVVSDLVRGDLPIAPIYEALLLREGEETEPDLRKIPALVTWSTDSALPKDLAALDEIALSCLDRDEWKSRRWLRLAPRYLGRMAQGLHLIESHREFSARFWKQLHERTNRGEIDFAFEVYSYGSGTPAQFRFDPPTSSWRAH